MPEIVRAARCACGDMRLGLSGEPLFVSSCCCTRCQRRTGSFFGVTVYYRPAQMIERSGPEAIFRPVGATTGFRFCPRCGTTLWWAPDDDDENVIGVAGGAFADVSLPAPRRMVHAEHRHPFVRPPDGLPIYAGEGWDIS